LQAGGGVAMFGRAVANQLHQQEETKIAGESETLTAGRRKGALNSRSGWGGQKKELRKSNCRTGGK